MDKVRFFLRESWLLIVASGVFGLLLAVTNAAWQDRIEANRRQKFESRAAALLPQADAFVEMDPIHVELGGGKTDTVQVRKAVREPDQTCVGWAFAAKGSGFADKIELVLAVDAAFEMLRGFAVLSSNETPGFGDKIKNAYFQDQFKGAPAAALTLVKTGEPTQIDDQIVAITGATVSSEAVVHIINAYVGAVRDAMQDKGWINDGR